MFYLIADALFEKKIAKKKIATLPSLFLYDQVSANTQFIFRPNKKNGPHHSPLFIYKAYASYPN